MVRGFDLFRNRLAAFGDSFIVIGGTACDLRLAPYGGFRRSPLTNTSAVSAGYSGSDRQLRQNKGNMRIFNMVPLQV